MRACVSSDDTNARIVCDLVVPQNSLLNAEDIETVVASSGRVAGLL